MKTLPLKAHDNKYIFEYLTKKYNTSNAGCAFIEIVDNDIHLQNYRLSLLYKLCIHYINDISINGRTIDVLSAMPFLYAVGVIKTCKSNILFKWITQQYISKNTLTDENKNILLNCREI